MKLKKKYAIIVSLWLCLSVVAAVFVINLLNPSNAFASGLSFGFRSDGANAKIKAAYIFDGQKTSMKSTLGEDYVLCDGTTQQSGYFAAPTEIVLSTKKSSVIFEYVVSNLSDGSNISVSANSQEFENNNMKVSYYYSCSQVEDLSQIMFSDTTTTFYTDSDASISEVYVYVKVAVDNLSKKAAFEGSLNLLVGAA